MTNIKRKICKILLIVTAMYFIFAVENVSEAASWGNIVSSGDGFLNEGKNSASSGSIILSEGEVNTVISLPDDDKIQSIINDIYNILFPLGVGVTVIIGGALGIKFMMASAEDKAKVKESLLPYVVGCIIIYGAFGIWKIAITIFSALG